MLTCLFVGYLVSLEYPLVSLWLPLETVLGTEMFLFGSRLILGGAYMRLRGHAPSMEGVGVVQSGELGELQRLTL